MEKLPFDYTIISHPRRKRIAISVTPEGKVIIRTPPRTARKRIEKMLEENAGWVMESLSRVQAGDRKKWRWEPGGVMPLLGQEMTVALGQKPGVDGGRILLSGDGPEDWHGAARHSTGRLQVNICRNWSANWNRWSV